MRSRSVLGAKRRHATRYKNANRTMCGRRAKTTAVDDMIPTCLVCLRAITRALLVLEREEEAAHAY